LLIGSAVAGAAATAGFGLMGSATPHLLIAGYVMAFGLLRSVQFMSSNTLAYADLPPEKLSGATSVGGMLQQLSVSFGVSLAATALGLFAGPRHLLTPQHFHEAFVALGVVPLLGIPGFFTLRRRTAPASAATSAGEIPPREQTALLIVGSTLSGAEPMLGSTVGNVRS